MAYKFKVGDVVVNKDGQVRYEITGQTIRGSTENYIIKVLASKIPRRIGKADFKTRASLEANMTLMKPGSINFIPVEIQIDGPLMIAEEYKPKYRGACDCGGHKCGYRDDELHGHARWCKLVEQSQGAKRC